MGLGNGNPKSGDKGSNFNYELKVLQGLEAIANALDGGGGSGDPTLNPGPAFSSAVFNAADIITFSDGDIVNMGAWGSYHKIGNIVTTDISIDINGISSMTGSIEIILPLQVVGDITSDVQYVVGTMDATQKILINYTFQAISDSTVSFNYTLGTTIPTVINLHISYVYNTNIAVVEIAPIIL
jgi:hypothetical protein